MRRLLFPTIHLRKLRSILKLNLNNRIAELDYPQRTEKLKINGKAIPMLVDEFWTSKQRQNNPIHEISYRACFKAELPRFFINLLTQEDDVVYDPFSGRGTTIIEASLLNRNVIANDINPLSVILSKPRFFIPSLTEIRERLDEIKLFRNLKAEIDISMFYHPHTESEIISLKKYLYDRKKSAGEDNVDNWIRMIATNRLTGHSANFFSVYTLPPNQAVSPERQRKINIARNQSPAYKNTKEIIFKKSKDLLKRIDESQVKQMKKIGVRAIFLSTDAGRTKEIKSGSVDLTVTSPPFLDVVNYRDDNWLRCWFNSIQTDSMADGVTFTKKLDGWEKVMRNVFTELYRVTKNGGWIAFEVGEVKKGKIKLEENVIPLGINAGFTCEGILVNLQKFTKTANIWGVSNNKAGTNTNRIVIFHKKK